jgi:hypothetical protein
VGWQQVTTAAHDVTSLPPPPDVRTYPWRIGWGASCSLAFHLLVALLVLFGIPQLPRHLPAFDEAVPVELVQNEGPLAAAAPGETAKHPQDETPPATVRAPPKQKPAASAAAKPHKKPPPTDDFSAQVKAIEAEQQRAARSDVVPRNGAGTSSRSLGGESWGQGGVKDVIRAQVERHWEFDVAALGAADIVISLHVRLDRNGMVMRVDVVDDPRYSANPSYRPLADSARRAVLVASPLQLPKGWSDVTSDIVLYLSPRDSLR